MPSDTALEKLRQLCVEHGCRCTKQRVAVYKYICNNKAHPTVDKIWENVNLQIPSITRESIFRILTEFAEWGIIYRMDKIINARFDGIPENHGHFICKKCGAIIDFALPPGMPEPEIRNGFQPDHVELRISGICAACAAKISTKKKS